ncbi:MAG: SpoIVB peptidase [Clostridia bacterium]
MRRNKRIFAYMTTLILCFSVFCCCTGFINIQNFDNYSYRQNSDAANFENVTFDEVGDCAKEKINSSAIDTQSETSELDCFANSNGDKKVFLGGYPLGIDLKLNSLMITEKTTVLTKDGLRSPFENFSIEYGDRLISINGIKINTISDINTVLKYCNGTLSVKIKHNNEVKTFEVNAELDMTSGKKRLGLLLQDSIAGIGTMTFVDPTTQRFSALGHPIKDMFGNIIEGENGALYSAEITNVIKGVKGKAGALNGKFGANSKKLGEIKSNNNFGLFGAFQNYNQGRLISLAGRDEVRIGKAFICTTIDKNLPKMYEIQIIKANKQDEPSDKSMVLRVVDKDLLEITGGIVQGMSGSPIIQNDKLIGAVTHVFINDPTKGYGLYADWMK